LFRNLAVECKLTNFRISCPGFTFRVSDFRTSEDRVYSRVGGNKERVHIGTSGWSYKSWDKTFYPAGVPHNRQFEFYASQFSTVEINATFYRLPTLKMVQGWRQKAPPEFIFAVKGSRFITHMKRLANLDGALHKYFTRLKALEEKIGVVLWQLPPNFHKDIERLENFLKRLPKMQNRAVEFRHLSWMHEQVFELLRRYNAAHVSVSSLGMPMNLTVTADIVYIRFHGLAGGAAHDYSREELAPWAEHINNQAASGKTIYAYFNNDANVRAPGNAKLLIEMTHNPRGGRTT
jgi:uncharacterized protein YecE (DUF72 family)